MNKYDHWPVNFKRVSAASEPTYVALDDRLTPSRLVRGIFYAVLTAGVGIAVLWFGAVVGF